MCPICRILGARCRADHDEGQELPPQAKQLVTRLDLDFTTSLLQCPSCQTHYRSVYHCDNDIFQPTHVSELTRISDDEAAQMLRVPEERRRQRRAVFMRRLRRRRGKPCGRLPKEEGQVVDCLLERQHDATSLSLLDERLGLGKQRLAAILARLEKKRILSRTSSAVKLT